MIDDLLGYDVVTRLVGCLLDSLWQGTLVALAAAALKLVLPRSAAVRYWLAVTALVAMLVVPMVSFVAGAPPVVASLAPPRLEADGTLALLATAPVAASLAAFDWTRMIAFAWLSGVLVCLLRLCVGWRATRTLVASAHLPVPASLARIFADLCRTLDVRSRVRLVLGEGNGAPAVVGWLRPVVWLPLVAVTGLSAEQLRAVLAHELAHVRRYDFVVNVVQRCIEALLFYHPAVWLVSAQIRAEREHCCDDAALAACGDRLTYAGALVELEVARSGVPRLAMAASGGNLAQRVRRVLGRDAYRRDWRDVLAVCTLTGVLLVMGACQSTQVAAQAADSAPALPVPPASPEAAPAPAPVPPAAASAPVPGAPAAAPAPRAPRAPDADFATSYFGSERPWALFVSDRTMYGGTRDDRRTARALHDSLGRDLLWFRDSGTAYVITDERMLRRVLELFEPMEKLGAEQRTLGEQQRALGDQQRQLGEQMRAAASKVPDLTPQLTELRGSVAQLQLKPDASPQEFAQLQRSLATLQGQLGHLQGEIGRQQGEIGRQQGELGRMQGELGRQQGDLGRQQGEAARAAQRALDELLRQAVDSGVAKRAPAGV
jgi:bla regulator protein blaR1